MELETDSPCLAATEGLYLLATHLSFHIPEIVHNALVLASSAYSITLLCPVYGVDVLKLAVGDYPRWFGDC